MELTLLTTVTTVRENRWNIGTGFFFIRKQYKMDSTTVDLAEFSVCDAGKYLSQPTVWALEG
jgi:hypothetical protein